MNKDILKAMKVISKEVVVKPKKSRYRKSK